MCVLFFIDTINKKAYIFYMIKTNRFVSFLSVSILTITGCSQSRLVLDLFFNYEYNLFEEYKEEESTSRSIGINQYVIYDNGSSTPYSERHSISTKLGESIIPKLKPYFTTDKHIGAGYVTGSYKDEALETMFESKELTDIKEDIHNIYVKLTPENKLNTLVNSGFFDGKYMNEYGAILIQDRNEFSIKYNGHALSAKVNNGISLIKTSIKFDGKSVSSEFADWVSCGLHPNFPYYDCPKNYVCHSYNVGDFYERFLDYIGLDSSKDDYSKHCYFKTLFKGVSYNNF